MQMWHDRGLQVQMRLQYLDWVHPIEVLRLLICSSGKTVRGAVPQPWRAGAAVSSQPRLCKPHRQQPQLMLRGYGPSSGVCLYIRHLLTCRSPWAKQQQQQVDRPECRFSPPLSTAAAVLLQDKCAEKVESLSPVVLHGPQQQQRVKRPQLCL